MLKTTLLGLILCLPMSALAEGNCHYVSYQNCYANYLAPHPHAWVRALCFVKSNRDEGAFGASDFNQCKTEARHLGQMVEVEFSDSTSKQEESATVYSAY